MECCSSSITINVKYPELSAKGAQVPFYIGKKFCVREVDSDVYLQQMPKDEWLKSGLLLVGNIVHNVFFKCIGVVIITFFSSLGVKFNDKTKDKAFNMWKGQSPLRSLIILMPQILINLAGVLTLGFLSYRLNWISGDLERWAVGDSRDDLINITRNARIARKDYLAPCEQPITILSNGISLDTQKPFPLFEAISNNEGRRQVFSILYNSSDSRKNVTINEWKELQTRIEES